MHMFINLACCRSCQNLGKSSPQDAGPSPAAAAWVIRAGNAQCTGKAPKIGVECNGENHLVTYLAVDGRKNSISPKSCGWPADIYLFHSISGSIGFIFRYLTSQYSQCFIGQNVGCVSTVTAYYSRHRLWQVFPLLFFILLLFYSFALWPVGDFPVKVDRFRHLEKPSGRIMFIFSLVHRCLGPWKLTSGRKIKSPLTQSLWMFENEVSKRLETSSEKKRP